MSRNVLNRLIVPRWMWDAWRFKLTPSGRLVCSIAFLASMGLITVNIPIYQTFTAVVVFLTTVFIVNLCVRPRVRISGQLPPTATAGHPIVGHFRVTNLRWSAFDLRLGFIDLPKQVLHVDRELSVPDLNADETLPFPVTLQATRRGIYALPPLRAYSTFPFQMFRSGSSRAPLPALTVLPAFHPLTTLNVPTNARHQPGGIALTSSIGESPEYIGNREYSPGEPVKRIDFRAWARLGKPVVREYQEEYYCRVAVVLDTFLKPRLTRAGFERWAEGWYFPSEPGPETHAELEAAVSLTAAIGDALSRGEYLIDLFAAGPELYVFQAGRNVAHFDNLLEILAGVERCREDPFERVGAALIDQLGQISTTICVFLDWDAARRRLAQAIQSAGCRLKCVIVRDRPTTLPFDEDEFGVLTEVTPAQVESGGLEAL